MARSTPAEAKAINVNATDVRPCITRVAEPLLQKKNLDKNLLHHLHMALWCSPPKTQHVSSVQAKPWHSYHAWKYKKRIVQKYLNLKLAVAAWSLFCMKIAARPLAGKTNICQSAQKFFAPFWAKIPWNLRPLIMRACSKNAAATLQAGISVQQQAHRLILDTRMDVGYSWYTMVWHSTHCTVFTML